MEIKRPTVAGTFIHKYVIEKDFGDIKVSNADGIALANYVLVLEQVVQEFIKRGEADAEKHN